MKINISENANWVSVKTLYYGQTFFYNSEHFMLLDNPKDKDKEKICVVRLRDGMLHNWSKDVIFEVLKTDCELNVKM